jgi:hypothetical protein
MSVKDDLRVLIDQISDDDAAAALAYLRWRAREQVLATTLDAAPIDDELETDDERALVAEAKASLARGEGIRAADIYRDFGV